MSLPKFLFFITEEDGRSRQIINGIVTSLSSPKALPNTPDGTADIVIGWERSPVYYGNIRNFSLPLGFVTDGATILRNDFYKFNMDRKLYLLIKRLTYENTDTTFKEYYKQIYKGEFDFSTGEDDQGGYRFNINLMEGGLQKQIKANEGTDYEIPFDLDAKNIEMDGMFIEGTFRWFLPEYVSSNEGFPSMYQLNNDNPVPGIAIFDTQDLGGGGTPDADSINYFAQTTQDIADVVLTGTIVNVEYSFTDLTLELIIFNTVSNTVRLTVDLAPDDPYPQNSNIIINETFDLLRGDRLFFKAGEGAISPVSFAESDMQLSAKSKPLPSTIKGFTIYDLGRKLTEKITGNADNFESPFLEAENIILTSGDGVRSLPNAAIKTNWRDYWEAVNVYTNAELTITDKIRVNAKVNAFDPAATPIPLGDIKNFKSTRALEYMGTSIKVGHEEQQVNDTNGKFDFNGFMIFNTPITAIADKQIDLQTRYKASPYEIEQTRANYEGKTTTDKETDNDVFALAVLPDAASDEFESSVVFNEDGAPFAPGQPLVSITAPTPKIAAGMKLRFVGSVLNTGDYTVAFTTPWFFGQLVVLNEDLVDESVNVTVQILEGQYYTLDRTPVISQLTSPDDVTQEIKDTVYNVPLSPKRLLLLHKEWLAGTLHGYAPGNLTFSSANRNKELISDGIIEKADVPIADLGTPMFLPWYFEFDTVSPVDMTEIFEATPNPSFSFIWNGNTYTGFFIRGGIALNDREEQTFKLLAHPDTDMTKLL